MKFDVEGLHPQIWQLIEWGSLLCATIFLVIREAYQPWFNGTVGLLGICWAARWTRTGRLTKSTPIDVPIVIFIISALVASWATPNYLAGLVRLYLILAAVTFFYTLVNSDLKTLRIFSSVFIAFAGFIGIFLASQYDWTQIPTRFSLIKDTGIWLNRLIPNLRLNLAHWNVVRNILASLLAFSLPVALLDLIFFKRKNIPSEYGTGLSNQNLHSINYLIAGLSLGLIIFGLFLTESRTPWVVFGVLLALWIWWWLSGRIKFKLPLSRTYIFLLGLGITFILVGFVVIRQPQLLSLIYRIPGPKNYLSRGEIYPQAWRLAQDTPFTGGGLAAFPALYSTYIRVIPYNAFLNEDTGNNAYLNLLVEQGWLGAVSYIVILLLALRTAIRRLDQMKNGDKSFVIAGILGLGFILVQGFVHATLVASRVIPILFIPAGLALAGSENWEKVTNSDTCHHNKPDIFCNHLRRRWKVTSVVIALMVSSTFIYFFRSDILSTWYANFGVVQMSQAELSDFPSDQWDDGSQVAALYPAEKLFKVALRYNPHNRTAQHRLGLIAMLHRDFPTAIANLERAHQLDPVHRGIRKNLGYSYVWAGQPELGFPLLVEIPEAIDEMVVYKWWWGTQGREDLAHRSEQMARVLQSGIGQ
jgi:hypothetical protein